MIDEETKRKRAEEGAKAMQDYLAGAKAADERTARLRALRLAQEAVPKPKKSAAKAAKAPAKPKKARAIPVEELTAANDK